MYIVLLFIITGAILILQHVKEELILTILYTVVFNLLQCIIYILYHWIIITDALICK